MDVVLVNDHGRPRLIVVTTVASLTVATTGTSTDAPRTQNKPDGRFSVDAMSVDVHGENFDNANGSLN